MLYFVISNKITKLIAENQLQGARERRDGIVILGMHNISGSLCFIVIVKQMMDYIRHECRQSGNQTGRIPPGMGVLVPVIAQGRKKAIDMISLFQSNV